MDGFRWIWMKCCMSTDVGTWTNWLTFEPNRDDSPDPRTGFTPDFWILAGYLKKLWMDFEEILCIDSCGVCTIWLGFEPDPDQLLSRNRIYTRFFNFLARYMNKLFTDFDDILCIDSCGGLHDLVRFWTRFESESGSWIRTYIQNCKADSAKSNGQISMKFYSRIACESRKTAFNFGSDRD